VLHFAALAIAFAAPLVFTAAVAPAVLRSLPSRDAAGALIASILRSVCLVMEIAFGVLFVTTGRVTGGRGGRGDALLRRVPVLGFVAVLAISYVVMPVLERLRQHPESDPGHALFARYHALSTMFFAIAFLCAIFLLAGTAIAEKGARDQK